MNRTTHPARRTLWLLSAAPVLLATQAVAQDAAVAPPAVQPTVTQSAPPAAAPAPAVEAAPTAAAPAKVRGADPNSTTPVNPAALEVVDDARQTARPERRAAAPRSTQRTQRAAPARAPQSAAPVAAAPSTAASPAPAPVASAPAPATAPDVAPAPEAAAPVADTVATDTTTSETATTTENTGGTPVWPWVALGAVIVLGLGLFLWRRNRANAYAEYDAEPVYVAEPVAAEPAPAAAPVTAAAAAAAPLAAAPRHDPVPEPIVAEDATVVDAGEAEVAALTDGAPVENRPWLEFAMRPVRAGTNVDEALVEIELTVANAGNIAAEDVRVSTFMLTDARASEMERLMVDPPVDAAVDPVTIQPGEGARIDATLAALKADIGQPGGGFTPVVVADARYRLPDGSEGRTSASFVVGVADAAGNIAPFAIDDREMREDIEARLHGEPQRV